MCQKLDGALSRSRVKHGLKKDALKITQNVSKIEGRARALSRLFELSFDMPISIYICVFSDKQHSRASRAQTSNTDSKMMP